MNRMDERIKRIADYYGYESQREQFIEECAEVIQASQKCKRTDIQNAQQYRERFNNFQEEVADVLIMALQMRVLLGEREIDSLIDYKLDRQIQRIEADSACLQNKGQSVAQAALRRVKEFAKENATDVQPIKHGRWIPQGNDMWLCSNCKENIIYLMSESDRTEKQRYCCRCGARMDLKDGDAE